MFNDQDADLQRELLAVFRIELDEKLQSLTDLLLRLEKGPPAPEREGILEEIFRAAHSIKGAARGVGLTEIADLSHRMESLFAALKKHPQHPATEAMDAALAALDCMRPVLSAFEAGEPLPEQRIAALNFRLTSLCDGMQGLSVPHQQARASRWRPPPPVEPVAEEKPVREAPPAVESETLRIPVEKLERLSAWAEEIQVTLQDRLDPGESLRAVVARVEALAERLDGRVESARSCQAAIEGLFAATAALQGELTRGSAHLRTLTRSLREEISRLRLVKVTTLTQPLPRMVRDLARELDKRVELVVDGEDPLVDRFLLNPLRDPMNHLLRNAVDHGIESPAARVALGKPDTGRIRLTFAQVGHRLRIRIEDDGAGMDPEAIMGVAIRKGMVGAEEGRAMSREDCLQLIFRPGFTSRELLTTLSGRGVGLDVVRTTLRGLQGSVRVESEPGRGTVFVLDLPMTMATQRGLLVRVAGRSVAIPSKQIDRILSVAPEMRVRIANREAVLVDGTPYPLVPLAGLLAWSDPLASRWERNWPAVVVSNGWRGVVLVVDDLVEDREMVIKKLPPPLSAVPGVMGGAILGSGRVVMVLDPVLLVDMAWRMPAQAHVISEGIHPVERPKRRILVVDDSITSRTLESNILTGVGHEVRLATQGEEAWEILLAEPGFDLVVTDVQMPVLDGFQLTGRIKGNLTLREIPVLIVSSLGSAEDQRRGVEVGADAYIVKGQFETRALLEMVEQLLP
ncbi:MAG: response regulator [Magnetococcales bacterium]|nr:response regulator [Magnetococcales bacterium]